MIEIDDAGSGSLIGGTGIGLFKKETEEFYFDLIPIQYFQPPFFSQKKYQEYVVTIIQKAFRQLKINTNDIIQLCPSYIFDYLRKWLSQHGYRWQNQKITAPLQNYVETSFNHYVINLGLPKNFVRHARYAFNFHRLFKWVMADYKNRNLLCKTGWKSWQKWSATTRKTYASIAANKEYCLKCGELIHKNEPVQVLTYQTNKLWILPLHPHCVHESKNTLE